LERKKDYELNCIKRAKIAAKEVRKRTLEASKSAGDLDDDDNVVSIKHHQSRSCFIRDLNISCSLS
jgi:hypothetical protein